MGPDKLNFVQSDLPNDPVTVCYPPPIKRKIDVRFIDPDDQNALIRILVNAKYKVWRQQVFICFEDVEDEADDE